MKGTQSKTRFSHRIDQKESRPFKTKIYGIATPNADRDILLSLSKLATIMLGILPSQLRTVCHAQLNRDNYRPSLNAPHDACMPSMKLREGASIILEVFGFLTQPSSHPLCVASLEPVILSWTIGSLALID